MTYIELWRKLSECPSLPKTASIRFENHGCSDWIYIQEFDFSVECPAPDHRSAAMLVVDALRKSGGTYSQYDMEHVDDYDNSLGIFTSCAIHFAGEHHVGEPSQDEVTALLSCLIKACGGTL